MFENADRTEISELGEFGLIEHLAQHFTLKNASSLLGVGDDCAVVEKDEKHFGLLSTEVFLEGVNFDLAYHPLKHLGYKLVSAVVSDVFAMNGKPEQIQVALGLSNRFGLEAIEELYAGIIIACDKYKVDLVGGDTATSRSGLVVSISVLGSVEKDQITYRKGAKANDLLVVSGDLGGAYMGLQVLEREKRVFMEVPNMQPDLEQYDYIVGKQLRAEARFDILDILKEVGVKPTAMMDVSDGVASEIFHLAKANNVGFDIYEEKLPIDPQTVETAIAFDLNPSIVALNGGEDYELLMTIDQGDYEKIKNIPDLTIIGYVTEAPLKNQLVTKSGNNFDIKAQGWPISQK